MDNGTPVGSGAYNSDVSLEVVDRMMRAHGPDISERPNIWGDFHPQVKEVGTSEVMERYCACPTLWHLVWWFGEFLDEMLSHGFRVVEYLVYECWDSVSGNQVMFHPADIVSADVIMEGHEVL